MSRRSKPQPIHLAIHRHENTVWYKPLSPEEFGLLAALMAGKTLGEAIDLALAGQPAPRRPAPRISPGGVRHLVYAGVVHHLTLRPVPERDGQDELLCLPPAGARAAEKPIRHWD